MSEQEGEDLPRLMSLCRELADPTLIFCASPGSASNVVRSLIQSGVGKATRETTRAGDWIARTYHPEWHVAKAVAQGIGVHHGRVPRALAQYVVGAFNRDQLNFLVCTSTLIEGVNTKAKNVIIYDDRISRSQIDFFTFNNIKGRSGRMGRHFIGRVYLFHPPPEERLPLVDIPAFTQPDETPDSLLMQLAEPDLSVRSRERLEPFRRQNILDYETLRENVGIDPSTQLRIADELRGNLRYWHQALNWNAFPTYDQLLEICKLFWRNFGGARLGSGSARSADQLAFLVNKLRSAPTTRELIQETLAYQTDPDNAVQQVLDFLKLWASFHFPRLLRALDRIQRDLFRRNGLRHGNFDYFASRVENFFLDPALVALDEYGIPVEVARKLRPVLDPSGDLDLVLARLKELKVENLILTPFEKQFVLDAQASL